MTKFTKTMTFVIA